MAMGDEGGSNDAAGLAAMIARAAEQTAGGKSGLPPVEAWNPPFCGDIDMVIARDGTWHYQGSPIGRAPLVRLFSTVLRRDADGRTYLVTPVEKLGIRVEDAPFTAVEMQVATAVGEPRLTFRTNVGDLVEAGPDHPLRFVTTGADQQWKPYLLVRGRLEALLTRSLAYDLLALGEVAEVEGVPTLVLRSAGAVFPVAPLADLEGLAP